MVVIMCFETPLGSTQATIPLFIVQSITQQGKTLAAYGILNKFQRVFHKYKVEDLLKPDCDDRLRFQLLPTSAEEDRLISMTSDTCRLLGMRFQYWDMVLRMTPFANTDDVTLFEVGPIMHSVPASVSPTQILILILRECFDSANPALAVLRGLNSQTATPDELLHALAPVSQKVMSAYVKDLTASYDYVHDMRDIYNCVLGRKY